MTTCFLFLSGAMYMEFVIMIQLLPVFLPRCSLCFTVLPAVPVTISVAGPYEDICPCDWTGS